MARDYFNVLLRATSELEPNTHEARFALYDRARTLVAGTKLDRDASASEQQALEEAIQKVESQYPELDAFGSRNAEQTLHTQPEVAGLFVEDTSPRPSKSRGLIVGAIAVSAIAVLGVAGYAYVRG